MLLKLFYECLRILKNMFRVFPNNNIEKKKHCGKYQQHTYKLWTILMTIFFSENVKILLN